MSFSQDVKKEIIAREAGGSCCAVAAAYGFACFGKYFDTRGVVLHTEQIAVAQYAKKMFARAGVAGKIYVKGSEESRVYEFAVKEPGEVRRMLALFGHTGEEPSLRINSRNFTCEHCVSAFVAAAFLCCGTITNPQREYNLEFLSVRYNLILDFEALLMGHGFAPKHTPAQRLQCALSESKRADRGSAHIHGSFRRGSGDHEPEGVQGFSKQSQSYYQL